MNPDENLKETKEDDKTSLEDIEKGKNQEESMDKKTLEKNLEDQEMPQKESEGTFPTKEEKFIDLDISPEDTVDCHDLKEKLDSENTEPEENQKEFKPVFRRSPTVTCISVMPKRFVWTLELPNVITGVATCVLTIPIR